MGEAAPVEAFDLLRRISGLRHGFLGRVPGLEIRTEDKEEALVRLRPCHEAARAGLGMGGWPLATAEQVHGIDVAVVDAESLGRAQTTRLEGVDALVTVLRGVALGIYVADCGAVYLADPVSGALGLVHSGKRGTEGNIVGRTLAVMRSRFGTEASDVFAVLSPCIRPPVYEIDFAAAIREQCGEAGVREERLEDRGICTSSDLERYYSYRVEKGATGRMLALMGWEP